jgi:glycosyltransferase involved in cell wall biosynthesis
VFYLRDYVSRRFFVEDLDLERPGLGISLTTRPSKGSTVLDKHEPLARLTFVGGTSNFMLGARFGMRLHTGHEQTFVRISREGESEWEYMDSRNVGSETTLHDGFFKHRHTGFRIEFYERNRVDSGVRTQGHIRLELEFLAEAGSVHGVSAGRRDEADAGEVWPRLLVIDSTPIGQASATGQLKRMLLNGWPRDRVLQIWESGDEAGHAFHELRLGQRIDESVGLRLREFDAEARCLHFAPDVIYFRPVDSEPLHALCDKVQRRLGKPLVVHVMDDWPERLRRNDPARFSQLDTRMRHAIRNAQALLSICDDMSSAFGARYGGRWIALANGVDANQFPPKNWLARPPVSESAPFVLRYMGGLADDMNFASVCDVAEAVSSLHGTVPLRFEICTMPWYRARAERLLGAQPGVVVSSLVDADHYPASLAEADALLIAYNFDESSIAYTQYSFANKLPECFASGCAVLGYGPPEVASIRYLMQSGCAKTVSVRDQVALRAALVALASNPAHARQLGDSGRVHARARMSKEDAVRRFRTVLRDAAAIAAADGTRTALPAEVDGFGSARRHHSIESMTWADFRPPWRVDSPIAPQPGSTASADPDRATMVWTSRVRLPAGKPDGAHMIVVAYEADPSVTVGLRVAGEDSSMEVLPQERLFHGYRAICVQSDTATDMNVTLSALVPHGARFTPGAVVAATLQRSPEPMTFREANRLFQQGRFSVAMDAYVDLYRQVPLAIYARSALLCAARMNLKRQTAEGISPAALP